LLPYLITLFMGKILLPGKALNNVQFLHLCQYIIASLFIILLRFNKFPLGVAVLHFEPLTNYQNQWIQLRDLCTEGQKTSLNPTQKKYKLFQTTIPFGLGFKLSVSKQITIGFEWGPRKTFTDYLDDVSGKYVDPFLLAREKGALAAMMSNRSKNSADYVNNVGKLRGNPNTKDWYVFYGFVISFKLKGKPKECKGAF